MKSKRLVKILMKRRAPVSGSDCFGHVLLVPHSLPRLCVFKFQVVLGEPHFDEAAHQLTNTATMSTFEPVVRLIPSVLHMGPHTLLEIAQDARKRFWMSMLRSVTGCHRWQGPSPRTIGIDRGQAAPQWPEDCCRPLRGPQHLRRVLPRKAYVFPQILPPLRRSASAAERTIARKRRDAMIGAVLTSIQ